MPRYSEAGWHFCGVARVVPWSVAPGTVPASGFHTFMTSLAFPVGIVACKLPACDQKLDVTFDIMTVFVEVVGLAKILKSCAQLPHWWCTVSPLFFSFPHHLGDALFGRWFPRDELELTTICEECWRPFWKLTLTYPTLWTYHCFARSSLVCNPKYLCQWCAIKAYLALAMVGPPFFVDMIGPFSEVIELDEVMSWHLWRSHASGFWCGLTRTV